jgi:hypothetical protein
MQTKFEKGTLEFSDLKGPTKSLITGVIDQNKEMMSYMRNLNVWLQRETNDRDAQMEALRAKVENERQSAYATPVEPETGMAPFYEMRDVG